jgi:carbon storage regulator CsrA
MGGLVLTRRPDEGVIIRPPNAPPVRMKVLKVTGNKVRFYFEADRSVQIDREEIDDRKQREENGGVNDDST